MDIGKNFAAKGLMDLLLQSNQKSNDDKNASPGGFSTLLSQYLRGFPAVAQYSGKVSDTQSGSSAITLFNTRSDAEYQKFYNTVASMETIEIPDGYYEIGDDGQRKLSDEGKEYIAKTRVENASTLAPSSIDEAKRLYEASSAYFGDQLNQFLTNSGYNTTMNYSIANIDSYQNIGVWQEGDDSHPEPFAQFFHASGAAKAFNVMAEETAFYGAIASLADEDQTFKNAYNADPKKAIRDYAQDIADAMGKVQLPEGKSCSMPENTRPQYRKWSDPGNPFDVFAPGLTFQPQNSIYEPIWKATDAWSQYNK